MVDGKSRRLGSYIETSTGGERVRAYMPTPLPPDPPLDLGRLMRLYERALAAVGRLDAVTTILPSTPLFLYMYVRKEALLSSQATRNDTPRGDC
jgi:hypothetical protein